MADSLRRRLIVILLGLILIVWLISMVVTGVVAQQLILRQAEKQLEGFMDVSHNIMVAILEDPAIREYFRRRISPLSTDASLIHLDGFGLEGQAQTANFWYHERQFVFSNDAPPLPAPVAEGFVTTRLGKGDDAPEWRILYRSEPELDAWLAVGVNMEDVQTVAAATFWRVVLPLLIVLPVTTAILFWGVGRGLRPLSRLAQKISTRKPHALNPIDTTDVPLEIRPVVESLNELLDRLERALSSEQRFTSNAAHELQTPLAAIKAEMQRNQREVKDEETRAMFDRISIRVKRATDTIRQLLTLARLDPDQEFQREMVELRDLLIEVIAEVGGVAADRGINLQLADGPTCLVEGNAEWLIILLQNLVMNAIHHSPEDGDIEILLERRNQDCRLVIANDCDPLAEAEFMKLTDRFYRPSGGKKHGVGLGLSIVERIAELHGAELRLDRWRGERGFVAEIRFPLLRATNLKENA